MTTYTPSLQTRAALIEAAGELFATHGFDAVTTRAIAQKADVNLGAIHYHFKGKVGLIEAAVHFAAQLGWSETLSDFIDSRPGWYETPESAARMVADLTAFHFDFIYDQTRPWWCGPLTYKALTYPGEVGKRFVEEIMLPHQEVLVNFIKKLKPEWSDEEAFAWKMCFMGQVALPSLMRAAYAHVYDCTQDPTEFINTLKTQATHNTVQGLGLPMPEDIYSK